MRGAAPDGASRSLGPSADGSREGRGLRGPHAQAAARWQEAASTSDAAMAKKSEQPPSSSWDIFKVAKKSVRLGTVEAPDKQAAVEKAAQEFKTEAWRLYAVERR